MITKGTVVQILKQFQDKGDDQYIWVAIDNEEKGRVTISPVNVALSVKPTYVVKTEWLQANH